MSQDRFTEVTSQGCLGRLGGAIGGVFFGVLMLIAGIALLFWNEGRAVKMARSLAEGQSKVISVSADSIDTANEGKLIHLSGDAKTDDTVSDDQFGISAKALALYRTVEMYQWQEARETETKKKLGGGTETTNTYSYSRTWSASHIDSSSFEHPENHENPGEWPYESKSAIASNVTLGAFRLTPELIKKANNRQALAPDQNAVEKVKTEAGARVQSTGGGFYFGGDPSSPKVGDVRVKFEVVPLGKVSVIARQFGSTFEPYKTRNGNKLYMLSVGERSKDDMFEEAKQQNNTLAWILRLVGVVLLGLGVLAILGPLQVVADVIPFIGNIVGAGSCLIAGIIAPCIALVVIALGWLTYRPLISIPLLVLAALGIVALAKAGKAKKVAKAAG